MSNQDRGKESEGGFYKGLFYGLVLGVGLIWFLGTKEGKKIKKEIVEKGQDFLENHQKLEETDEDEVLPPDSTIS